MSNALRLLRLFVRLGLLGDLAYRGNFWFQVLESVLMLATSLATLGVVFFQTEELAGWGPYELVALLGVYFLVRGVLSIVVSPSFEKFMEDVRSGGLDFTLLKPVDAQLLVSIQEVRVWKGVDSLLGAALLALALPKLAVPLGPTELAAFALALAAGVAIVYSVWLVLVTLAFWWIRVENILVIFWNLYWCARWPIRIYPDWLRWLLTLVVPVGFAVTVPAEALAGRIHAPDLAWAVVIALASLALSRRFWLRGLRHYAGASA
jgi:ABC-2 type transport system permease protein